MYKSQWRESICLYRQWKSISMGQTVFASSTIFFLPIFPLLIKSLEIFFTLQHEGINYIYICSHF